MPSTVARQPPACPRRAVSRACRLSRGGRSPPLPACGWGRAQAPISCARFHFERLRDVWVQELFLWLQRTVVVSRSGRQGLAGVGGSELSGFGCVSRAASGLRVDPALPCCAVGGILTFLRRETVDGNMGNESVPVTEV